MFCSKCGAQLTDGSAFCSSCGANLSGGATAAQSAEVERLYKIAREAKERGDAITVFGKYVMDTHIKDGFYPTDGLHLGREVKVGEGMANLPEVIRRLKEVGYTGNYIIEREISGEQQTKDIKETLEYLKTLV